MRKPGIGDGVLTVKAQAINVSSHDPRLSAVYVKWNDIVHVNACFSGYLPGACNITWTGSQGAALIQ